MILTGLFPGQGSQSVGMGQELFLNNEISKNTFEIADQALGFSISKLCFEGPSEELTLTKNAQPAILATSIAAYRAFSQDLSAAAGHSLGEYSALVAAGSLSLEDAVCLVHKRGAYMQEAVQPGEGAMVAVMGPKEEEIQSAINKLDSGICEIANLNCPGQTVVAGDEKSVSLFAKLIAESGAKVIPLNVSAPFHCSLMQPAAEKLAADLDLTEIKDCKFPVFSNISAKSERSASKIRQNLKDQVCGTVRWSNSMTNMISEIKPNHCIEFGSGAVLSKLLKRTDKSVSRLEVSDPGSLLKVEDLFA